MNQNAMRTTVVFIYYSPDPLYINQFPRTALKTAGQLHLYAHASDLGRDILPPTTQLPINSIQLSVVLKFIPIAP